MKDGMPLPDPPLSPPDEPLVPDVLEVRIDRLGRSRDDEDDMGPESTIRFYDLLARISRLDFLSHALPLARPAGLHGCVGTTSPVS